VDTALIVRRVGLVNTCGIGDLWGFSWMSRNGGVFRK